MAMDISMLIKRRLAHHLTFGNTYENYEGDDHNPPLNVKLQHVREWMCHPNPTFTHMEQASDICAKLLHIQCMHDLLGWDGSCLKRDLLNIEERKLMAGTGDEDVWVYSFWAEHHMKELCRKYP